MALFLALILTFFVHHVADSIRGSNGLVLQLRRPDNGQHHYHNHEDQLIFLSHPVGPQYKDLL